MGHMSPAIKAKKGRFGVGGIAPTITVSGMPAVFTTLVGQSGMTSAANDATDGDISASSTWTSDLDGLVGTGAAPTITLTTLGAHVITVVATAPTGPQTATTTVNTTVVA